MPEKTNSEILSFPYGKAKYNWSPFVTPYALLLYKKLKMPFSLQQDQGHFN